ncbi:MAG: hypothetical protein HQK98_12290 [Nitrospirae bacterium]|nr:hypothetical protein [Nitrospirota bacterium]
MGKTKGDKKTGGRTKGAKNKRTLELENRLREAGFDPVSILVDMAVDPETDGALRAKICLDAMQYLYPKRRAIDSTVNLDAHVETWEDRVANLNGNGDEQA